GLIGQLGKAVDGVLERLVVCLKLSSGSVAQELVRQLSIFDKGDHTLNGTLFGLRLEVARDGRQAIDRGARWLTALYPLLAEELFGGLVGRAPTRGGELQHRVLLRADRDQRFGRVLRLPARRQVQFELQPGVVERVPFDVSL